MTDELIDQAAEAYLRAHPASLSFWHFLQLVAAGWIQLTNTISHREAKGGHATRSRAR